MSILIACNGEQNYTPKPMGYARIDFPKNVDWKSFSSNACPYTFQYPSYATVVGEEGNCNQSIIYPKFKAALYATYIPLDNEVKTQSLFFHSEYSRNLVYEHSIKADEISETAYANDTNNVYGIIYKIKGNVATNYQFYLTDSVNHFYRASLYFNISPNIDSIKPALDFLTEDIDKLIHTFKWN